MNKILYNELKKVTSTKIDFSEDDLKIFIPRSIKILNSSLKVGLVYIIKLNDTITDPFSGSTLASNWNRGIIPKHKEYIVEILEGMANMIKVNGVATEDNQDQFLGWLPLDGFETISRED